MLQHHQAFWGGRQGFAGPVDQWEAEAVLQALNGTAEGGLGDAHGLFAGTPAPTGTAQVSRLVWSLWERACPRRIQSRFSG